MLARSPGLYYRVVLHPQNPRVAVYRFITLGYIPLLS